MALIRICLSLLVLTAALGCSGSGETGTLAGVVSGAGTRLAAFRVTLYETVGTGSARERASGETDANGRFQFTYAASGNPEAVFYLTADNGAGVRLAGAAAGAQLPDEVVLNERTTIAAAWALAQFIEDAGETTVIEGNSPGLANAAATAASLADPVNGTIAAVLGNPRRTSTPYHSPTFSMEAHGSRGGKAAPCWSSSTEMPSGERTNAI